MAHPEDQTAGARRARINVFRMAVDDTEALTALPRGMLSTLELMSAGLAQIAPAIATFFVAIAIYVFMSWAENAGFGNNTHAPVQASYPFPAAAGNAAGPLRDVMYIAGFTSAAAVLLAAGNPTSRVWFNMAREGVLPRWFGQVHPRSRTPARVIVLFVSIEMAITLAVGFSIGADNGFGDLASAGTIGAVILFIAVNFALTAYSPGPAGTCSRSRATSSPRPWGRSPSPIRSTRPSNPSSPARSTGSGCRRAESRIAGAGTRLLGPAETARLVASYGITLPEPPPASCGGASLTCRSCSCPCSRPASSCWPAPSATPSSVP